MGCLSIRRVPRLRAGDPVGRAGLATATDADARAQALISESLLHRVPEGDRAGDLLLSTRAYDQPALQRCPALGPDMRCAIHDDRKPAACAVVPLDELVPDRLQHLVLEARHTEASFLGADCVVPGRRTGTERITHRLAVVGRDSAVALARRRRDLVGEKRHWGDAVFRRLQAELGDHPGALARIPPNGVLVLTIAPVIAVVAAASPRCRRRCIEYLDAQTALLGRTVPGADDGARRTLSSFARANHLLRERLVNAPAAPSGQRGADVEAWMGLAPPAPGQWEAR